MTAGVIAAPTRIAGGVVHGTLTRDGRALGFAEAMAALAEPAARAALSAALAAAPFAAFFWECAPATAAGAEPFAYALTPSPTLAGVRPDPSAFGAALARGATAAVFENLGGDSLLVAPGPFEPQAAGGHLAAFVRGAPPAVVDAVWAAVPGAVARWFSEGRRVLWLSTSGLAVPWLHLRLDPRPKYYTHAPFRAAPRSAQ